MCRVGRGRRLGFKGSSISGPARAALGLTGSDPFPQRSYICVDGERRCGYWFDPVEAEKALAVHER